MDDRIVYVLELESGKYYIGSTQCSRLDVRIDEHYHMLGSAYTKRYPMVSVVETHEMTDEFTEDNITKRYMMKYGIDNVRGGSYVSIKLPKYQLMALNKELGSSEDVCWKCGKSGHYITQCKAKRQKSKRFKNHTWFDKACKTIEKSLK